MIPVLFKGNETNFNHNGIGLLKDTLSCEVSEVRNGSFDLELVYPITGSYFKDLKNGNIIQAKPNDTDQPHNFRITEIDKTLSDKEVVVYGVSTTNDLGGNMVKSLYLEDVTPQVILNEMKKALHYTTTFNFVSNITTIGSVDWELNNPLNLIVGEEGSLVDIFGGEVKRTNDTIYLYGRRGKDNVTTIRAGKNLDGFKMTESFQGKYTQILPYFKYEAEIPGEVSGDTEGETIRQEVTVFGSIVSSPYHGRYPVNAIKPIDFSQNETVREAKTLEALNAEAALYFSDLYSEIDKPSVNINVDMVQLVDSEQYELYERLEKIELTDTVSVYVPEYDVDVLVKITELKYDSLRERTISIVAGSSGRTSLMDEISGSYKKFTTTLVDDKIQSATSGIVNQILTQKNGVNMYAGRATPPDNAKKGDIWFKDTGGGDVELYEFDGANWIRKMYKGFSDDVRQLVDDKIAESNALFTGALEEHDNTIAQAMTKAEQANDLAQQAKTDAANASLSASAANQDAQQAITDAANARESALSAITEATNARQSATKAETKVNQLIGEVSSKVSKTDYDALNGRVTNAESNITQQAGQIELKANKSEFDTVKQTVDSTTSRVTLTEQSITSLVSGAKTLPDGRTSVFATKIESLEGEINQRVTTQELTNKGYQTATDVTNKLAGYVTNQTYTTYTTARQQTDGQITEQINQTVSKVPTGPVNLIVNGFDPQTISPWTFGGIGNSFVLATHDVFYKSQKKLYLLGTSNTTEVFAWTNIFNLKRNTKYTLRIGLFANSSTKSCDICFMGKPAGGSFTIQVLRTINDLSAVRVVYYTMTFDSGSFDLGQFRIDNSGSKTQGTQADLYICEVSCIEGEYNNSWTPSFDELITEQKFNETKSTVDAFSRAIGTRDETGFVPNIARLVMTQDAVISEVAKYGEHNSNLVQDSVRFSTTSEVNGSGPTVIADGNITWRKSGATTNTGAGIRIPVNVKRFIAGEKYTLSFEYYLYNSPDDDIWVVIKDHTNNRGYCYGHIANASTPIETYRYFQQTFTINTGTASNTILQDMYFYLVKNGAIGIRNVMLVRGEKIGPYSTSQVDLVTSRVEQTANSYSVKFLNNANDITTQLNLTSSGVRIKSSLIRLDGNVTVSGTAWMDGAVIKNLSADKITTGTLNANNVNITNLSVNNVSGITATYLQSIIGTAFIDWMKGKVIQGYNNNMTIDLLGGNITLNSGSNAIKRVKGTHTAFVHFNDVAGSHDGNVGSLYACIGVTSSGDGVNSMSSGRFAGLRAFRGASGTQHDSTVDQTEIYGDKIILKDDFTLTRGFIIRPVNLDRSYDLNDDILNPIRFFTRLLIHLNNIGWNWQNGAFLDALNNDWNNFGMGRYGTFRNNTIYKP